MTVTITVPAELEAKIAERAAPVRKQIKAAGVTDEELTAQIEEAVAEVRTRPRG